MAGQTVEKVKPTKFKPDPEVDRSRTSSEKRKDWREAEAKVYGKRYVSAHEKRIEAEKKVAKIEKTKHEQSS